MKRKFEIFSLSLFLLMSFVCFSAFADEKSDLGYIRVSKFNGVIFPSSYDIKDLQFLSLQNYERWEPKESDVVKAEELLKGYFSQYSGNNEYYNRCIPRILEEIDKYGRQYFGLINKQGHKVIWINYYYGPEEFRNRNKSLVFVKDGGHHYFNIKINLTTKECYDLMINGEA